MNVGLPRDVSWQGRTVRTAVWKRPADGPRLARRLNLVGDGQGDLAGHGGEQRAVFVYQIEAYQYWQQQLGRNDFEYGQFGENLTVRGLADDEVCIGDRYQIGEALFEVTQPRVTCFRVGIRMDDPRIPALLVSHHRPGFYFRVLREGAVQAGDEIVRVARGPQAMTVAEIDALLYLPGHPAEQVRRALTIPALSPGWQASFRELAAQADNGKGTGNAGLAAASPPPAWPGFRSLTVTAIERESESVISLRLADPAGAPLPAAAPGQFVSVRLRPHPDQPPLLRSYSLSGAPDAGSYRVSVKREEHGTASHYVHDRVRAGDRLEVAAPRGTFILRPGTAPVLLISAGVGATPVLSMLHALADAGPGREVWWLHGARNRAEEPFAAEARSLLDRLPRAHRHVCYSQPGPGDVVGRDYQSAGRLSADVLARLALPRDAEAYICGPNGFMADATAALGKLGLGGGQIRTEIFGARPALTPGIAAAAAVPPHQPAGTPGSGPEVAFARSGLTVRWDQRYASLLELAEACDVPVRWSCRTGVCHNCESGLLSGEVGYSPDPVDDPADGDVLICCAQPTGDVALDL
ncbi:MOSC and FAD-binding oxidoreductase domain-containing protein [Trebonia kvetii]|uniref:MOSC and FAD-binding oxidoreductase domain-containing protein n=1 Tax=Trebonia kvetii TaxID=2480626 RepID=UPI001FEABD7A|nr:MOSC and FAD-binding oxidoreductase domain-containing protein [Trebonia kvetii]